MEDQEGLRQPHDAAPTTSHRYASVRGGCVRQKGPSAAELLPVAGRAISQPGLVTASSLSRPAPLTQQRPIAQNAKRSQSKTQPASTVSANHSCFDTAQRASEPSLLPGTISGSLAVDPERPSRDRRSSWHETAPWRLCPVPALGSGDPAQGPLLGERRRVGRNWTMGFEPGLFVRPPLRLAKIERSSSYRSVSLSRWFSRSCQRFGEWR